MAATDYSLTTPFPGGLTNAAPWQTMGNAGTPDPTWAYHVWDDFQFKDTNKWSLSGTGTPAWSVGSNVNGIAAVTCTVGATDSAGLYQSGGYFSLGSKPIFFKATVAITNATGAGEFGLSDAPTTSGGNGLYFQYAGGSDLTFQIKNGAATQQVTLTGFRMSQAVGTPAELGFYYDGRGNVYVFVNPTTGANTPINAAAGQPRGYVAALSATAFTANPVAMKAQYLAAGNTAGNTMYLDYLVTSAER